MLLARMAEAVYWAGRYLERAEGTARIVQVHTDAHVDMPVGEDVGWEPLLAIAGVDSEFAERYRRAADPEDVRAAEEDVIEFLLHGEGNPSSILASLTAARENLRTARPVVPREAWEACNNLWLSSIDHLAEAHTREGRVQWLRRVIAGCQWIHGILLGTMSRDEAMSFLVLGQNLERADLTTRVLDVRSDNLHMQRRRRPLRRGPLDGGAPLAGRLPALPPGHAGPPQGGSTLRFLLQDDRFPRAVGACLTEARAQLKVLPHAEGPMEACQNASMVVAAAPGPPDRGWSRRVPRGCAAGAGRDPRAGRRHLLPTQLRRLGADGRHPVTTAAPVGPLGSPDGTAPPGPVAGYRRAARAGRTSSSTPDGTVRARWKPVAAAVDGYGRRRAVGPTGRTGPAAPQRGRHLQRRRGRPQPPPAVDARPGAARPRPGRVVRPRDVPWPSACAVLDLRQRRPLRRAHPAPGGSCRPRSSSATRPSSALLRHRPAAGPTDLFLTAVDVVREADGGSGPWPTGPRLRPDWATPWSTGRRCRASSHAAPVIGSGAPGRILPGHPGRRRPGGAGRTWTSPGWSSLPPARCPRPTSSTPTWPRTSAIRWSRGGTWSSRTTACGCGRSPVSTPSTR